VPGAALRGAGKPADQTADRGALTGIATHQPSYQCTARGARGSATQCPTVWRAGTIARSRTITWRAVTRSRTVTRRTISRRPIAWRAILSKLDGPGRSAQEAKHGGGNQEEISHPDAPLCRSPEESRDISNVRVKRERYEMADGWLAF
jgi:hypothetical protein